MQRMAGPSEELKGFGPGRLTAIRVTTTWELIDGIQHSRDVLSVSIDRGPFYALAGEVDAMLQLGDIVTGQYLESDRTVRNITRVPA